MFCSTHTYHTKCIVCAVGIRTGLAKCASPVLSKLESVKGGALKRKSALYPTNRIVNTLGCILMAAILTPAVLLQ